MSAGELTAILRQLIAVSRDLVLAIALPEQIFGSARRIAPQIGNDVESSLLPLVVDDSPYKNWVVALVDQPASAADQEAVESLRRPLGDRLFVLSNTRLETYISPDAFVRAGLIKADVLEDLANLAKGSDVQALFARKSHVAKAIAAVLTADDLADLEAIRAAVKRAATVWKGPALVGAWYEGCYR